MNTSKAASLLLRAAALCLALAAVTSRDSSAKAVLFQAAPIVPVPNMVAYWAVDGDTGGMASDLSGNNNNGTYSGGITTSTTVPNGTTTIPAGNTTSFNLVQASNQYINVPDSASLSVTGSFTLAAWVRTTLDSTLQQGIIEKYDTGNGYSLRIGANEHYGFSVFNGATQKNITTAGTAVPFRGADINQWNHVAGVYQQGVVPNMQIFKNGNPDATTSANSGQEPVAPPTNGTANLQIGKDYGSNAFQGQIDEVRIYNRALSQAEVQILRDGQPAPTGLVAAGIAGGNRLTWVAPAGAPAGITYSVLSGPSAGTYTTNVANGITALTYDHMTAAPGVATHYAVVAVTVMASPRSNNSSAIPGPAGPPPPPPPPRTTKVGGEDNPCGCGSTSVPGGWVALFGVALLLAATLTRRA